LRRFFYRRFYMDNPIQPKETSVPLSSGRKWHAISLPVKLVVGALGAMTLSMALAQPIIIAPPAPRYEVVPAARPGYVWSRGHWNWDGGRWVWGGGRWQPVRYGHRWREGRWERRGPNWRWHEGIWVR
jgi:hypothetical protein